MGYKGKQVYKPLAVWLALSMTPAAAIAAADVGAQMDQQLQAKLYRHRIFNRVPCAY